MKYEVKLMQSEEGYAVWCPELPGCWSQGETETEALDNIRTAISEYLESQGHDGLQKAQTRTVDVG